MRGTSGITPLVAKSYKQGPQALTFLTQVLRATRSTLRQQEWSVASSQESPQARVQGENNREKPFPTGKGQIGGPEANSQEEKAKNCIKFFIKHTLDLQRLQLTLESSFRKRESGSTHQEAICASSLGRTPQTCTHQEHMPQTTSLESQQQTRSSVDHRIKITHLQ